MQIVKLGGSVVSPDDATGLYSESNVRRLGKELRRYPDVLVVHGVGAWGRALVTQAPPEDGFPAADVARVRSLRQGLGELARRVERSLRQIGLPVVSIDPVDAFEAADDGFASIEPQSLTAMLEAGRLPLLRGGPLDRRDGRFGILSSDRIVAVLASRIPTERVVWVTDVDGVLLRGGEPQAYLSTLTRTARHRAARLPGDRADPTGGMTAKLDAAFEIADRGVPSIVVNGLHAGRLSAALRGDRSVGTAIDGC